ncbi:MAG: class I SAM-dependent methyltransferase [Betaproteobacteria bacterium]|nr:class I SAM-dependent methyltransferase [Betaproteobacteria bacterium]
MSSVDYTRYYKRFILIRRSTQAMTDYAQRILGPHLPADRTGALLDVGCGTGYALLALKQLGFSAASGVDSDAGQVAEAVKRGVSVVFVADTQAFLRERAGHFDIILALDVIEHLPWPQQIDFVQSMCEALNPTGRLICTVPNANSTLASRWRYNDWTHQSSFTEHSLDFCCSAVALRRFRCCQSSSWSARQLVVASHERCARGWALRFFRFIRRLQMMAELGPEQGRAVPLSLNLMGVASK